MVQTKRGVESNPWVEYMKACAEHYRLGHTTPPPLSKDDAGQTPANKKIKGGKGKHDTTWQGPHDKNVATIPSTIDDASNSSPLNLPVQPPLSIEFSAPPS